MKNLIAFSMLLFLLSGCSMFEEDEQQSEYGKINFAIYYPPDDLPYPELFLSIGTEKLYPSNGYKLDIEKKLVNRNLILKIKGVIRPAAVEGSPTRAHTEISLKELK
ncbi:MAG TPA: hypothetical protein VHP30_06245, partial [Ignavibacteriales bacterium]|nr:hypothetical protein [Ignavibacteriales bacterium]